MNIESTLRKEGIEVVKKLDTLKINSISQKIANKLYIAFPEHGFNKQDLFARFSRLNMFIAKMPDNLVGAKYFSKNNAIYFNADFNLEEVDVFAIHECLHCIQESLDIYGNLAFLGMHNINKEEGLAINEATIQLMTCEALKIKPEEVKYYNLNINTISPNYYPLECALVNQMAYFTGSYPLYHSALNCNDIFKNTFIALSDEKTFYTVFNNLDKILLLEDHLSYYINELSFANSNHKIKSLNNVIEKGKQEISKLFFQSQDIIISHCFSKEFNSIKDLDSLNDFKNRLYNFKNIIGYNDSYTFYNEFYCHTMEALESKKLYIEEHGAFDFEKELTKDITIISNTKGVFALFKRILTRLSFARQKSLY